MQFDYTVFASTKVPADRVKAITEIIATHKDALGESQPLFKSMEVGRMFTGIEVPYHDGAKAYYAENGIKEGK
jgi:TRAP-type uncharacterized transport system substrate-binding protein